MATCTTQPLTAKRRRPAWGGGEPAPLQIKLRSRGGASARGIGCPSRDAVWAGPTGLRQWPRSGIREPTAVAARCGAGSPVGVWEPWLGVAEPPGSAARVARDAEVWPAGSVGDRTGDAERADAELSAEPGRCAGALAPQLRPPAERGLGPGKLCPRGTEQRLGGGGSGRGRPVGRRPSAVCFFSLPAAAAGDEEDGGAKAERPRLPGVTVAPSGFPAPLPPQGPGHACAVRAGVPTWRADADSLLSG